MMPLKKSFFILLLFLCGCAPGIPRLAAQLEQQEGFVARRFTAGDFELFGLLRQGHGDTLTVVIEGDGFAWQTRNRPSTNPTPRDSAALRLAQKEALNRVQGGSVLYLARPGQYPREGMEGVVPVRYWTNARFAPEVVRSLDEAIDEAKRLTGTSRLRLTGFSGGGGLAVLVAARRDDVTFLTTYAGTLDHELWTTHHKVSPLRDSLNPIDAAKRLAPLPQRHLSSRNDTVMPPQISARYCRALGRDEACMVVEGLTHDGAWENIMTPD